MARRRERRRIRTGKAQTNYFDPRYLRHEVMLATAALVVCLFVATGIVERVVRDMGSPYVAAVIAAVLVDLANEDRAALALPELTVSPALTAAAQAKADDMARKGYFSHTTLEGHDSWYWFKEAGYDYQFAGENLAVNFSDSGDVEKAWMNSPTHRDNIMNARYTEIGIAVAEGTYEGRPAIFAVQMFGRPKGSLAVTPVVAESETSSVSASVDSSVLGEASEAVPHEGEAMGALAEQDGDAAMIVEPGKVPWWGSLVAQPKENLRYAYYVIGLLILAALFFDMELELKWHHVRHAMKAGILLATMSMLFVVADWVFFAEPVLAVLGALW